MAKHVEQRVPRPEELAQILEDFKRLNPAHFALAQDIFMTFVDPEASHKRQPSETERDQCDMAFSEWVLFDLLFDEGDSLITLAAKEREEFAEFAGTQFYGRFWVVDRHPRKGTCVLRDVQNQHDYQVESAHIAGKKGWRTGSLGVRIARVNGVWRPAGQIFLHDNAEWDPLPPCFDECEDPYDPSAFITNIRQVLGHHGEFRESATAHTWS